MPLSKARNRERMRAKRGIRVVQSAVQPNHQNLVQPTNAELQAMIHNIEQKSVKESPEYQRSKIVIPWYNPEIHTTGDIVRMKVNDLIKVVTL